MSLAPYEVRCQGATAIFANAVQRGALPGDCIKCLRRTDIVPSYPHRYITAPTWLPWGNCPQRVTAEQAEEQQT